MTSSITARPVSPIIGAEIVDLDLARPLDEATRKQIQYLWMQHLVLLFRGQKLSDPELERFSAAFGSLDRKPAYTDEVLDTTTSDYVCVISNVKMDGKPIGDLGDGEAVWHTDMSYNDVPPLGAALYALEVPSGEGGETGFSNMYLAYETLPSGLKRRIEILQCKHDATRNSAGGLRRGMPEARDPRESPGAVHPMVRTHPVTGRNALYLGRRHNAYIPGLSLEESEALLDEVWAHATQPRFSWHHSWRAGDVLMWDNRCVMHRRNAFDPAARRIMHRTQIQGDKPVFRPHAAEPQSARV
jgi:taurine dioxygenase